LPLLSFSLFHDYHVRFCDIGDDFISGGFKGGDGARCNHPILKTKMVGFSEQKMRKNKLILSIISFKNVL
jgi:hypothetical protein